MASDDFENGVWRTIGGHKIFIKDGEDLKTAMKKSGKFKKKDIKTKDGKENLTNKKEKSTNEKKSLTEEERNKKIKELEKKKDETQGFLQKGAIQEEINMLKDNFEGTKEEYREYIAKEQERRLAEYREEKNQRIKEFQNKTGEEDYRMAHRPTETGLTADNLLKKGNEGISAPKDIYEHPEYYSSGNKEWISETINQLNKVRNNPNEKVTIYRATTGDKINNGDWITLSRKYAETHNESQLDGKGKVLEMKVKASDIQFAGDMLEEWGYFPKNNKVKKETNSNKIYLKAYNEYKKEHPNSKITFTKFKENIK